MRPCSGEGGGHVTHAHAPAPPQHRFMEKQVQGDILQETFINTMPAWVNLLLLSSSGPIKTPVGACATAVESVEIAVDTLLSGKAKVVIAGGYDDFQVHDIVGNGCKAQCFFFLTGSYSAGACEAM
jgi:3-oxoacyl-(acyl-carrier-protein) synthase